jgi:hypothetical protein
LQALSLLDVVVLSIEPAIQRPPKPGNVKPNDAWHLTPTLALERWVLGGQAYVQFNKSCIRSHFVLYFLSRALLQILCGFLQAAASGGRHFSKSAGHIPMPLHLECRPQIFESISDDWHHLFISRPGGFLSVKDVELVVKKRPREVLTVSPTKGAKVPKYIVDEKMGPM